MRKICSTLFSLLFVSAFAQDRTTVNAMNSEVSDNLDLRAVASIFGDSKNLEDFEYRLNDPKNQISNLDLNNDNQVDYLRVIESTEGRTHIIVIQSILGRDLFQDVATVEVEKDRNNRIQIQVVGDVYMYGSNYIYEPIYVHTPIIYDYFWVPNYRPYCSSWYWGYYPSFYYAWNPYPIFRYRSHIDLCINFGHHYNYVNYRRCNVAYTNYYGRRANGYERQYPNRSFSDRHSGYTNRHELDKTRNIRTVGTKDAVASANTRSNTNNNPRDYSNNTPRPNTRGNSTSETPRDNSYSSPRPNTRGNSTSETPRDNSYSTPRPNPKGNTTSETPRDNSYSTPRPNPKGNTTSETPRGNSYESPRGNTSETPRGNSYETPRGNSAETPRGNSYESPRGNTAETPRGNSTNTPRGNSYESPRGNTAESPRGNSNSTPRPIYNGSTTSESPRGNSGNSSSSSSPRGNSGGGSGSSRGNSGQSGSRR